MTTASQPATPACGASSRPSGGSPLSRPGSSSPALRERKRKSTTATDRWSGTPSPAKYRRTRLFVLTLAYSRKSVRLLVRRSSAQVWAALHEQAFRWLGGTTRVVVLDNLKEGVLTPDVYDPALNPLYRDVLAHYGVVALPCRVRDPDRKAAALSAAARLLSGWGAGDGADVGGAGVGPAAGYGAAGLGATSPGGAALGTAAGPAGFGPAGGLGGFATGWDPLGDFSGLGAGMDPLGGSEFQLALGRGEPDEETRPGRRWQVWGQGTSRRARGAVSGHGLRGRGADGLRGGGHGAVGTLAGGGGGLAQQRRWRLACGLGARRAVRRT